ncbi:MAG: hypothetical protein GWN17_10810 [Candidatus Korarchaeota archaeon]|nr:hypothetical protein [Candidatus Korarchaeota archaeon]
MTEVFLFKGKNELWLFVHERTETQWKKGNALGPFISLFMSIAPNIEKGVAGVPK